MIETNWIKKWIPNRTNYNSNDVGIYTIYQTLSRGYVSQEEMRKGVISSDLPPIEGKKLRECIFVPMPEFDKSISN